MKAAVVKKWILDVLQVGIVGGVSILFIFGNPVDLYHTGGWPLLLSLIWRNGICTAVFWYGNAYLSDILDEHLQWTEKPVQRFYVSILTTVVYTSIAFGFIIWAWTFDQIGWDAMSLFKSFRLRQFLPTLLITFCISLFLHGRTFLLNWRQTLLEAERLKREQVAARYEALKSQVNPHFLFNSLNVLSSLVHRDADMAEKFIRQLSDVYRYILDSRSKETVPIKEELSILRSYLFLMDIRFGTALQTNISIPDNTRGHLAPLTLQMLVENALKHNEISKSNPLHIEVFLENEDWIVVRNNLSPKNILPESTGVGLANIQSQYQLLSEKAVLITDHDGFFTVKIPVLNDE
ncbi:MAG: histidine kinase [Bacteroidetes bacterium]|nr:histidine kinase [Bacteroidota bacterium]